MNINIEALFVALFSFVVIVGIIFYFISAWQAIKDFVKTLKKDTNETKH